MNGPTYLTETPSVINIGLESFAEDLRAQGAEVVQVQWRPPAGGDLRLLALLGRLGDDMETEPTAQP